MSTSPRTPRSFFPVDLTPLLLTGWQTNKFDGSIPFWAEVNNLQFTETSIKRKPGRTLIGSTGGSVIRGMQSTLEYDTKVLYVGDLTSIYAWRQNEPTIFNDVVGTSYNLVENAGSTLWDSGSSTWDAAEGGSTWDDGIAISSVWSFTNFGTWVLAADDVGPIKIKKNNETFAELLSGKISGVNITTAGSGHAVGDTLTFSGGSGSNFAAKVTQVSNGAVTRLRVTNYGLGYANLDSLTQGSTSGSGTSLVVQATIPDCTFTRVKAIDKSGPHILAINYDEGSLKSPYDVAWSAEDDPDTWVASATNAAGSLTLREASSELACITPLGEAKAIYTQDQMFILNYIGAPFYFGYETAMASGVGAVSPKSVVPVNRLNYGLSRNGVFMTDGNSVTDIGNKEGINSWLKQNVSSNDYPKISAVHNQENNEVIWYLPVNSSTVNTELSYNYTTGVFSKSYNSNVNISEAMTAGTFIHNITADSSGNVYFENGGPSSHNTLGLTKAHDLEDPYSVKELTSIRVGKTGTGSPQVRIGWANNIDDEPTFNPNDTFLVGDKFKEFNIRTSGRYLFLEVSSTANTDNWEITNMLIKGRIRGFR